MSFISPALFLLVVISSCCADTCQNIVIEQTSADSLSGVYVKEALRITFMARIERNEVVSVTKFHSDEFMFEASLSFPNTNSPEMVGRIIPAATDISAETQCHILSSMTTIYEEFADTLYDCSKSLGSSQLRFGPMYHVSVMGTAERICLGKEPVCTPSPSYEFGEELFMCMEDIEDFFPELEQKEKEIKNEVLDHSRQRRGCGWYISGWGLRGRDRCCCGNYPGCCYYAHVLCCAHDYVCNCCEHWYCGPQCRKSKGC